MNPLVRRIVIGVVAVAVTGTLVYRAVFMKSSPTVITVDVRKGAISQEVSETGEVIASDDLDLFFKNVGRVAEVLVREGDVVTIGQPLMRQATGEFDVHLRSALSSLASARAKFAQALAGAPKEEVRVAETAVSNAKARVAAAEQALADARTALTDTGESNETALAKAYGDYKATLETLFVKASAAYFSLKNDALDANERMTFVSVPDTHLAAARQLIDGFPATKTNFTALETDLAALRLLQDRVRIDELAAIFIGRVQTIRGSLQSADSILQASTPAGSLSQSAYDTKKANVKSALVDLNTALNATDVQTLAVASAKTANATALTTALTKVNNASAALDTARYDAQSASEKLASMTAPLREVDKEVYRAAIAAAEAEVELARQQLTETSLAAPKAGLVGSIDLDPGEMASPTARAATLISTTHQVEATVSELDIGKMAVGMPVSVIFDALGATAYGGKIAEIGARDVKQDEDIYYKVTVLLDDAAAPLRPGMTAELTIPIGAKKDAILIPRRLLIRRGGRTAARLYRDGAVEEVEVRVGLEGDDDIEIIDGLREGDKVVDRIE